MGADFICLVKENMWLQNFFVYGRKEVTVYQPNGPIKVYGISGQMVYQNNRSVGTETISTENWSAGVYILSSGNSNFKIIVE